MERKTLRIEDASLLTGAGQFVDDVRLPNMLAAAFLRSSYAHATIKSIDMSEARKRPGVHAVYSLAELRPHMAVHRLVVALPNAAIRRALDRPVLADGEVRHVGEPIAVVIADNRYIAEDAVDNILVEYEPLPAVADCLGALKPDAPMAHLGAPDNVVAEFDLKFGDAQSAFQSAAHVFSESLCVTRGGSHSIECRGNVAAFDRATGQITLWSSTQTPHAAMRLIAELLGRDESTIRVIVPDVGGGFGPKLVFYQEDIVVVVAAMLLDRPVKWIEDRREHFNACACRKPSRADNCGRITQALCPMRESCKLVWLALVGLFRSRASLLAEILVLRHQLNIQRRRVPKRYAFGVNDRLIFAVLYWLAPTVINALAIVKPETVIKWHRAGFKSFWRWKSRRGGGRPVVPLETRQLVRAMSIENPLWGAPRIHGELLKLGFDIGQTSVAKYIVRRKGPPSQGWKTFLHNHADGIAAMDLFVVPTISFRLLYGLLIMGHGRRHILWFGVTAHPTAEWIANQITEACGWEQVPRYLVRDRDGAYGEIFIRRLRSMGIRDRPTSLRSPWQNGYCERLIGSIRRDCLDHVVVFGERHLRHLLRSYASYYNQNRTHLFLNKDTPASRAIQTVGRILPLPILGGLHHQYVRI